mmetsp:Transcript_42172/g.132851  ORF Transcript_42172/g.132851 Transcript_42172/m.132851 type:complete len:108 (-) Transcript_42172:376-699(-)
MCRGLPFSAATIDLRASWGCIGTRFFLRVLHLQDATSSLVNLVFTEGSVQPTLYLFGLRDRCTSSLTAREVGRYGKSETGIVSDKEEREGDARSDGRMEARSRNFRR